MAMNMRVQHVMVKVSKKGYNLLTVKEFLDLSLLERMELTINDKVEFLDAYGNKISGVDAIKQMEQYLTAIAV